MAEMYSPGAFIKNKWRGGNEKLYVVRDVVGPDVIAREVFRRCEEIGAAHEAKLNAA